MTQEHRPPPRPYEIFGITEEEVSRWRIADAKLKEIIADPNTTINKIMIAENNYGEFMFLTVSRGVGERRTCMTFWGLGYHEFRERWIHQEWFWYQTTSNLIDPLKRLTKDEALERLQNRRDDIAPNLNEDEQSEQARMFEILADMTDEDAALAEMQDLGLL